MSESVEQEPLSPAHDGQPVTAPPPAHARTGIERHAVEERALEQRSDNWRDEISSRLSSYAQRRGRKRLAGDYSMQLDFDRPRRSSVATAEALQPIFDEPESEPVQQSAPANVVPQTMLDPGPADSEWRPSMTTAEIASSHDVPAPAPVRAEPAPVPEPSKRRTQHRIIEFPRLFPIERTENTFDELAETLDKPRILDVPEETEQIVLPLADISLEMQQAAEDAPPAREFELPIQVAAVSQRVFAGIVDNTIVLFATVLFAGVALSVAKGLPHNKLTLMAGLVTPCVLWAMYHYLFLVHSATTPGMKIAQLRLAAFNGASTTRQIRRTRALGIVLSLVSACMGFGWALVDEDTLCWHDRISRTFLTNR